jgi:hypothetical protein
MAEQQLRAFLEIWYYHGYQTPCLRTCTCSQRIILFLFFFFFLISFTTQGGF